VPAGTAKPGPAIGQALGPLGLNMMEFCKAFNAETANFIPNTPMQVPPEKEKKDGTHTEPWGGGVGGSGGRRRRLSIMHNGRRRRQTCTHTCPCVADVVCVWMGYESTLGRAVVVTCVAGPWCMWGRASRVLASATS
jgi:hypothetical protein